jgi:hypothetical protein
LKSASATPTPTRTLTAKSTASAKTAAKTATTGTTADTSAHNGAKTVPNAAQVSLCVEVAPSKPSSERGQAAQWTVSAWTTGGRVTDAILRLQATPASGGAPGFSFGCGKDDGTSTCDLGAVDAKSAPRQLQAQLTVPVSASTVKSVNLTVTGSTAHLAKALKASAAVAITAPPSSVGAPPNPVTDPPLPVGDPPAPDPITSPLPVGSLPGIPAASPTLSSGGNAAGLFPTLDPTPTTGHGPSASKARTRPVADTSALPQGATVVDAQLAGLAALGLAFVLAVTRLSIRRRPAATPPAAGAPAATPAGEPKEPGTPTTEPGKEAPSDSAQDAPAQDEN